MRFGTTALVLGCVLVAASCGGGSTAEPGGTTTTAVPTTAAPTTTTSTAPTTTRPPTTTTTTTTTTAMPPPELATGLLCRDVEAAGYGFAEALAYWVREGLPDRMDEDGDGIPCETVYPAAEVDAVLDFDAANPLPAGKLCRDVNAAGYGFLDALAYWVREGAPARMDADHNGLPCETVYAWGDILAVMAFDGAAYESPEPPPGVTIGDIATDVQGRLQAWWDGESDHPEGVLGPFRVTCEDEDARVTEGDVFACAGLPNTAPDFQLDPVGIVFLVLDDNGKVSATWGTDVPDRTEVYGAMFDEVGSGFLCKDLVESDDAGYFTARGGTPMGNYFSALLYWFLDGMPGRMDEDGDGIPCETVFGQDAIETVWSGGGLAEL
jgi:hypothetical protein